MVDAFRSWGIYPENVRALSVESLLWQPPETPISLRSIIDQFQCRDWDLSCDRKEMFLRMRRHGAMLHRDLPKLGLGGRALGLMLGDDAVPDH